MNSQNLKFIVRNTNGINQEKSATNFLFTTSFFHFFFFNITKKGKKEKKKNLFIISLFPSISPAAKRMGSHLNFDTIVLAFVTDSTEITKTKEKRKEKEPPPSIEHSEPSPLLSSD